MTGPNKAKGETIERFVREWLNLQPSETQKYDAIQSNGRQVEIKSTELIVKNKNRRRYGRFSILPNAHENLDKRALYVFVVTINWKPVLAVKLSWKKVNKILEKYRNKTKRFKLHISEVMFKQKITIFGEM